MCFVALVEYPLLSGENLRHMAEPDFHAVLLTKSLIKHNFWKQEAKLVDWQYLCRQDVNDYYEAAAIISLPPNKNSETVNEKPPLENI